MTWSLEWLFSFSLIKAETVVNINERTSFEDCVERAQSHDLFSFFMRT